MDKVTKEFEKLINQGKINKAKRVKATKRIYDLKAAGIIRKTIKYNPQINEPPKEYIDFYLLHEEGHFVNPVKGVEWFYLIIPFLLVVTVTLLAKFNIIPVNLLFPSGFMTMLFLIYSIHVWLIDVYQKYEYLADDYACKNVDDPLNGISALNHLPVKKINKWIGYFLITLGAGYAHPSDEKRIKRIKKNYHESNETASSDAPQ